MTATHIETRRKAHADAKPASKRTKRTKNASKSRMTTPIDDLDDFAALDPFFRIIEKDWKASLTDDTSSISWPKT